MACMDNGTMVEAFKYLNYCQLAKNSRVSNRFRNLIQTHRHSLPLLYIDDIGMTRSIASAAVRVFDKELSSDEYNEWVISNNYSKQAPLEDQAAVYRLHAYAHYKDPSHREWKDRATVFNAHVELNHENWPAFQHFVRLATDPFIYIGCARLTYQDDVLNLLAGAITSDHGRLQCKELNFDLIDDSQKFITWTKGHVRCNQLNVFGNVYFNEVVLNELFLDLFVTAAQCTPSIEISCCDLSRVVVNFVLKFIDLKNSREVQLVEAIQGKIYDPTIDLFKRNYADFFVKEERNEDGNCTKQVFEFINNDIGKKLQLIMKYYYVVRYYRTSKFFIKITKL